MLTESNVIEFARRISDLFERRHSLPPGVRGYTVYNGWFPSNLDEILNDVLAGQPYAGDVQPILIAEPIDYNEGYDGYIHFDIEDGVLTVYAERYRAGNPPVVNVNRQTGAVTIGTETRELPDGWRLVEFGGANAVVNNNILSFTMAVDLEDDDYDDDYDDDEYDDDDYDYDEYPY